MEKKPCACQKPTFAGDCMKVRNCCASALAGPLVTIQKVRVRPVPEVASGYTGELADGDVLERDALMKLCRDAVVVPTSE
jgi:hypothetical protein